MPYIRQLLESLSPKHGAKNVYLDTDIELVFYEMMMFSSLNEETVYIVPKSDVSSKILVKYNYKQTTKTLTLTPEKPLERNTEYLIIIKGGSSGVRSMRGSVNIRDVDYSFLTGEETLKKETENDSLEDIEESPEKETSPEESTISEDVAPDVYASFPAGSEDDESLRVEPLSYIDFRVVRTYPSANSLWEKEESIAIKFSQEIELPSNDLVQLVVKPISDLLEAKKIINTTLSLSEDETILYIKPSGQIDSGEEFRLTISGNLLSKEGESLGNKYILDLLSHFEFFYLDVETLKLVGGQFVVSFSDIELAKLIGNASVNLYNTLIAIEEAMGGNYTIVTGIESPYGANQYILYSVLYQTILGSSLTTASGQKRNWRLGDLSTESGTTVASSLPDLLKMLKDEMNRWWDILISKDPLAADEDEIYKNWHRQSTSVTRGSTEFPYPDFQTRVPFNDLGGNV